MQNYTLANVLPGMDESYSLVVDNVGDTGTLKAANFVGVLRGLETFAQLFSSPSAIAIPAVAIQDSPRFSWRGLMIDTARHFLPLQTILHALDGMAAMKMNVLHIHLVDAESWPVTTQFVCGVVYSLIFNLYF